MGKTAYHSIHLRLTHDQMVRLAQGNTIRLKYDALVSGDARDEIHVTATQYKRIAKAIAGGKGVDLQMSQTQLRHHHANVRVGSGFGDFLRNGALSAVNYVGNKGLDVVGSVAKGQVGAVTGLLPDAFGISSGAERLAKRGIDAGTAYGKDKLTSTLNGYKSGQGVLKQVKGRSRPINLDQVLNGSGLYLPH